MIILIFSILTALSNELGTTDCGAVYRTWDWPDKKIVDVTFLANADTQIPRDHLNTAIDANTKHIRALNEAHQVDYA